MHNQRARFRRWIASNRTTKRSSVTALLKCTPSELWEWLLNHPNNIDSKFTKDNYGDVWEIDHVVPLSSVDPEDKMQVSKVWHFTNLQPLTVRENRRKGSRCDYGNS